MITLWKHKRFPDVVYALIPSQDGSTSVPPALICIGEEHGLCSCHSSFVRELTEGDFANWTHVTTISNWQLQPALKAIVTACSQT